MELRKIIIDGLKNSNIAPEEISAETNFILRHFFNVENFYLPINYTDQQLLDLKEIFEKRKMGLPLQYILGKSDFMGEIFKVNKNVLIPRPETEILVLKTIEKAEKNLAKTILDIGTGSGCIPIMLKKRLSFLDIYSCDISQEALSIAKENAKNNNANINFIHSDLFQNINHKFDIIVSNPPYIPPSLKKDIQKEVQYEPDLALYTSDENGVEFYEKIIKNASKYLNHNGYILFELGIGQSEIVKSLFLEYNYNDIEITKDLDGIDRVICARG